MVPGPNPGTYVARGMNMSTSSMDADASIGDDDFFRAI